MVSLCRAKHLLVDRFFLLPCALAWKGCRYMSSDMDALKILTFSFSQCRRSFVPKRRKASLKVSSSHLKLLCLTVFSYKNPLLHLHTHSWKRHLCSNDHCSGQTQEKGRWQQKLLRCVPRAATRSVGSPCWIGSDEEFQFGKR